MNLRLRFFITILLFLTGVGCSEEYLSKRSDFPKNLDECLWKATKRGEVGASLFFQKQCYEMFTFLSRSEDGYPFGSFYYQSSENDCVQMDFNQKGLISHSHSGFCDNGSRFEFAADGSLYFTCLQTSESKRPIVYLTEARADMGILLTSKTDGPSFSLFRTLAECVLALPKEKPEKSQ